MDAAAFWLVQMAKMMIRKSLELKPWKKVR